jgi:hypothetical protein
MPDCTHAVMSLISAGTVQQILQHEFQRQQKWNYEQYGSAIVAILQ